MSNMKKMALLLLIAAASNSATAQNVVKLRIGEPYTITSSAEADATIKYQWYRDGSTIPGAIGTSYTVPTEEAFGSNVQFKRATYLDGCPERKFSNAVVITWCNLKVGETCWADANVTQPGAFAARPDMYTEFYQWNQPNAWPASGSISGTWTTNLTAPSWTFNPCPEGWRLPTYAEIEALHNLPGDMDGVGGYLAAAGARGSAVAGRFYGETAALGQTTCTLSGSMTGCTFLPATGLRNSDDGALFYQDIEGGYWSSTQSNATMGGRLRFGSSYIPIAGSDKATGYNIRCVQ